MIFRHGRAHDQNGIRVSKILLCGSSAPAPEGGAQTGHRRAMSYASLVADTHHSQAGRKQFLDEIIFFIVERGSA
jgi:hypothetical protein